MFATNSVLNMKRISVLTILFIINTCLIKFCPVITEWDRIFIKFLQNGMKDVPVVLALLPDCSLYSIMIVLPIIVVSAYFIRKKEWIKTGLYASIPLVSFIFNCVIKRLIQRQRPPFEYQIQIHPDSFSYVSSHSLVTFSLWVMTMIIVNSECKNKTFKNIFNFFAILWIIYVGISRIRLGVHNPSDVIGAYLLGGIIVLIYLNIFNKFCRKG